MDQETINELRSLNIPKQHHFINGVQAVSSDSHDIDVISPIDGQVFTQIADGTKADVDKAVSAARLAFEDGRWSRQAPATRKKVLLRFAELIEEHALSLTVLGVRDNGTEFGMAYKGEALSAANTCRYYAESTDKVYGEIAPTDNTILGLIHRVPVGVVGAIVPWNFPLMIGAWKFAPALAAGNSVVLKPPESASLTLLKLAELAAEAGLPDGVFNVVTGRGETVGEALALSMGVDVLAFTGSGKTGRRLLEYSARSNLKRCYLELGGKSPNIVFADTTDLDHAAKVSAAGIFRNSGQVCVAGSRLLVEESIHEEFTERLCDYAKAYRVGDPLNLDNDIGAVHSADALSANLAAVGEALESGAVLHCGGSQLLADSGGFYMAPTVIGAVKPESQLFQNEVFGPVLAITPFHDEQDAVQLANNSKLGLAAGVWTSNLGRAHRMIQAVRAGVVHINTYGGADVSVPLGGVKESGNGHDKSLHALDKYCDLKTAWIQL